MQAQALDNLVPDTVLQIIIGRPDLAAFEPKLQWIKSQAEHHRGTVQAQQVSGSAKALHSLPVDGEQAWPAPEWTDTASIVQQVLYAMKGKGKGAKGSGKGCGKSTMLWSSASGTTLSSA